MKRDLSKLYEKNLELTRKAVKDSIKQDNLIIQAAKSIDEIKVVINRVAKRLREWYELYNPEFSRSIADHVKFAALIQENQKKAKDSMGADLSRKDIDAFLVLADEINSLNKAKKKLNDYLESVMKQHCANLQHLAGTNIGAKLIEQAGGLKHLMEMPSSTVQLLGAEKALFRHLKTGAKCPKYGIILQHQLVSSAKDRARAARVLADKISIAVRVDYFKGEFVADKLKKEVEEKV